MKNTRLIIAGLLTVNLVLLAGCGASTGTSEKSRTDTVKQEKQTAAVSQAEFYYTANEGGTITKINTANNEAAATLSADGVVHNIQLSPDGKIVAATLVPKPEGGHGDHGGHDMGLPGRVLFYDVQTDRLLKEVEVGNHPAHVVYSADGSKVLVTNNEDNTVSVIDAKSYKLETTISTGKSPHGFRISNDSKYAYIANMGEDTISVINLENLKEEKRIAVGKTPVTTGITEDGKTLVATLFAEDALAIIDLDTEAVVKVGVGHGPAQVYLDPNDQYAYVANQGTEAEPSNSLTIVDLKSKKAVDEIVTGKGSHGVVVSSDSKFAYVTNMFENTVSIIDLTSKQVSTIEVGKIPNGITIMD